MRGTTATLLTLLLASALAVSGCGGSQIAADEVTVDPPTLTIPKDSKISAASTPDADATATATATVDPATGATGTTGTSGTTAAPATGTGGTTAAPAAPAATAAPQGNTGGASADQDFDEFCANNPGAC